MSVHIEENEIEVEKNTEISRGKRVLPINAEFHGDLFFVKLNGRWTATPLALVLLTVEITDLLFALDSVPAIFAVTSDPFIIYTSNIFAIMGLRSLYVALAGLMDKFHYL